MGDCGHDAPKVCLHCRLEVELADMREIVALATKQVALRYASYDVSAALDWREESKRIPYAELRERREPFTGVNP